MKSLFLGLLLAIVWGASAWAESPNAAIGNDLVRLDGTGLVSAGNDALKEKKVIALYYSAHWCPPCKLFTPELVKFYDEVSKVNPEFELVFVSADQDAEAMKKYMEWGKMNFPAISYDKIENAWVKKQAAEWIPYLVVVDGEGNVLAGKDAKGEAVGAPETLAKLKTLLKS